MKNTDLNTEVEKQAVQDTALLKKTSHRKVKVNNLNLSDCHDLPVLDLQFLALKLEESKKISSLATGYSKTAKGGAKLRLNYELLQDLILKLLLSDIQGQELKPADTVHLARALKEIILMNEKMIPPKLSKSTSSTHAIKQAMLALGLLGDEQYNCAKEAKQADETNLISTDITIENPKEKPAQ